MYKFLEKETKEGKRQLRTLLTQSSRLLWLNTKIYTFFNFRIHRLVCFFFCFFCFFFHSQQISSSSPSTRCRDQHVAVIKFTHVHTFDRSVAVAPTCRLRWLVVMLRRNQERMYWHTNLHFTTKYIGKIMSDWNVLHFTPLPDQLLNLQHLQVG